MDNNKINFLKQYNIDVDKGIENTADFETYNEILTDYFNELPNEINKLVTFLNNNDLTNYSITVHALKSNSRCLGFTTFGEICYKHEMESKAGNKNFIMSNFNVLSDEAKKVYAIIQKYMTI